jgi:hypothetical protein
MKENIDWWSKSEVFCDAVLKCVELGKSGLIKELEKDDLSKLYDQTEDGLVMYNLFMQKAPESMRNYYSKESKSGFKMDTYLESQLFGIALYSLIKDGEQNLFDKFSESLWAKKLKNRSHYDKVSELVGIPEQHRETWYKRICE